MSRSKADPNHIIQATFDEESESSRVKLVNTEINMELSAADGDSITSHPVKLTASVLECAAIDNNTVIIPPLDCSSLREVHVSVDGSGSVDVMVSPNLGGPFFYKVGNENSILKICAQRIKVVSNNVIGNVHLVGRS